MVGSKEEASIDSTGLEAGHRSAHYARRMDQKRYKIKRWPKLTLVCHNRTHLVIDALLTTGPSHDAPLLVPVLRGAVQRVRIDRVLADAGYDAEGNHATARQELGVRSTVIALNKRGGRRWSKTRYRRQMYRHFHKLVYRQRNQVESLFSRLKRRLSETLHGRSTPTQESETYLRLLTHDLLILAA